jgi:hypothetical protein
MPSYPEGTVLRLHMWDRNRLKEPAYAIVCDDNEHITLLHSDEQLELGEYHDPTDPPQGLSWIDYWQPVGDNFDWSLDAWDLEEEVVPEDDVPAEVWARLALRKLIG